MDFFKEILNFSIVDVLDIFLVATLLYYAYKLLKGTSDWGFRDDIPYGGWRKDQKAWMVNKDYSRKGAYYARVQLYPAHYAYVYAWRDFTFGFQYVCVMDVWFCY